jgi:hypothetical protein
MKLEKLNEVSNIDQFIAVMDFLKAMGYDTSKLSVMDVAYLKGDIVRAIDNCEDPFAEYMGYKIEEGDLPL